MRITIVLAVICLLSCSLLKPVAGQAEAAAETPALPGVLAALNISNANVTTVEAAAPDTISNATSADAANATSNVVTPAANVTQPPLDANAISAASSSSSNATEASGNASFPIPQPWVGQLANASGLNASDNATADAAADGSAASGDALAEYITLSNNMGMTVVVLPLGAIIQRLIVPDK
jgi:hypothetical protein